MQQPGAFSCVFVTGSCANCDLSLMSEETGLKAWQKSYFVILFVCSTSGSLLPLLEGMM